MFDSAMNYHKCLSNFWNIIWILIWQMLFEAINFPWESCWLRIVGLSHQIMGLFFSCSSMSCISHVRCIWMKNWKYLHQESNLGCHTTTRCPNHNETIHPWCETSHPLKWNDSPLRWDDSPPEVKRFTPSNETIRPLKWDDSSPEVRRFTPWGETTHSLRWDDSPPEVKRFTPWGETIHPLRWDNSPFEVRRFTPLEVKRLRHEILSRPAAPRIKVPGLNLFQMKCMACMGLGTWCCNCRICFYQP